MSPKQKACGERMSWVDELKQVLSVVLVLLVIILFAVTWYAVRIDVENERLNARYIEKCVHAEKFNWGDCHGGSALSSAPLYEFQKMIFVFMSIVTVLIVFIQKKRGRKNEAI